MTSDRASSSGAHDEGFWREFLTSGASRTWVGAVGHGSRVELTAVGDAVNTTARLASLASAGEIIVTVEAATAAALDLSSLERQRLELRGKHQTIDAVRLRVGPADAVSAA